MYLVGKENELIIITIIIDGEENPRKHVPRNNELPFILCDPLKTKSYFSWQQTYFFAKRQRAKDKL